MPTQPDVIDSRDQTVTPSPPAKKSFKSLAVAVMVVAGEPVDTRTQIFLANANFLANEKTTTRGTDIYVGDMRRMQGVDMKDMHSKARAAVLQSTRTQSHTGKMTKTLQALSKRNLYERR